MARRNVAITVLFAFIMQVLLGGGSGGLTLCLGSMHDHSAADVIAECELTCDHEAPFPVPVPANDPSHDGCPCADVEIGLSELIVTTRDAHPDVLTGEKFPIGNWTVPEARPVEARHGPPPRWSRVAAMQRPTLSIVRTTRLLI